MKIKNKYILVVIIILFPVLSFSQEYNYEIDKEHFSLGFLVEHAGYAKTLGMFTKINGSFTHDEKANQISNVKIESNQANYGGGIFITNSDPMINNIEAFNNNAISGAGIFINHYSNTTLFNSNFNKSY